MISAWEGVMVGLRSEEGIRERNKTPGYISGNTRESRLTENNSDICVKPKKSQLKNRVRRHNLKY